MAKPLRQPGIFGQLCWDSYTGFLLGFPEKPGVIQDDVIVALEKSASKLMEAYPYLAGQIVTHGRTDTNSGKYKIIPYLPRDGHSPIRRKDCTESCPSYEQIQRAHAPFSMLDEGILRPKVEKNAEQPVFIVQANFIKGGLLLFFAFHHNALDITSHGTAVRMFAAAGRGEPFDPKFVELNNQDADAVVPFLRPGEQGLDHDNFRRPSTLHGVTDGPAEELMWNLWRFPAEKVAELKKMASGGPIWVSTNDAITAFLMQRVTAVRLANKHLNEDEAVHCRRAVNVRSKLQPPVDNGYLASLVVETVTKWPKATALVQASLAEASINLWESLKEIDDHYVRSLATLIRDTEDKSTLFYGGKMNLKNDIMISSWAHLDWFSTCSFGDRIGIPDFLTRPHSGMPSVAFVFPKNKEGHLTLGVNISYADSAGLLKDPIWRNFTEFIG